MTKKRTNTSILRANKLEWHESSMKCFGATEAQILCFAGGLQVSICDLTPKFNPSRYFRIAVSHGHPIRALKGRYLTMAKAKRAAEAFFVPLLAIAPKMVRVQPTKITTEWPR